MKSIKHFLPLMLIAAGTLLTSCSKKNNVTPEKTINVPGFWHGFNGTSPNQVAVAFLLRSNGTMREYDNDFYTSGTTMNASDTANAAFKIDGTYTTTIKGTGNSDTTHITMSYTYSQINLQHNFTNTGVIIGSTMTGTWRDDYVTAGIFTTNSFTLTK